MKHRIVSVFLITIASQVAVTADGIAFGPVRAQPGESVRLTSRSESREGVIELAKDGKTSRETIRFYRERELSWTFPTLPIRLVVNKSFAKSAGF